MATAAGTSSSSEGAGKGRRYRLFAPIGAGGMGTVYIGRLRSSANFARTVAIKRPLPELARSPELRDSIRREARVAARVHHPNVVATLDVVEVEGELWVVMEYVHGPALATLFALARERQHAIPLDIALALIEGTLRGLEAVHAARDESGAPLGIVHRDLSPHNVICGSDGMARVADFGLARAEAMTSITHTARFKGKLAYASPEQAESSPLTPASDLYSTGIILWELLTGQRLYTGATGTEIVARLLTAKIPPPSSRQASVPAALDAIVLRALERDPKRRYATASEMLDALKGVRAAASVDAVALWLRELAGDWMAERERLLGLAERGADGDPVERAAAGASSERDPSGVFPSIQRAITSRTLMRGAGVALGLGLVWFGAEVMLSSERHGSEPRRSVSVELPLSVEASGGGGAPAGHDEGLAPSVQRAAGTPRRSSTRGAARSASAVEASASHRQSLSDAGAPVDSPGARRPSAEPGVAPPKAQPVVPPGATRIGGAAGAPRVATGSAGAAGAAAEAWRAAPAAGHAACDPPYSVDAEGIRHMRPGCQ